MWTIVGALLIGLLLGLLGSGGSILTVPVLVYLLGHEAKPAIAESLAIVGGISAAGAIPYAAARQIDWRNAWFFGIPGMIGTYLGAGLAHYVAAVVQLILFAGVMLLAAWMMFRQSPPPDEASEANGSDHRHPLWKIVVEGLVVGIITGLVGVGGGFLIIPALVLLGGLPMRLAVGTSLVVIAIKSFVGFLKYLDVLADSGHHLDWITVAWFMGIGIAGTIAGKSLGSLMNQKALQRTFAIFLVMMGLFVFSQEVPKLFGAKKLTAGTGQPASVEPTTKAASDPAMASVANQADQQEQAVEPQVAKFDMPRTPKDALQELKAGNVRFLEGKLINPHRESNYRESLCLRPNIHLR